MERDTPQRRAIRRALRDAGRPLTPEEVLGVGRERVPTLGIATVYRNLKALHGEGFAAAVELPGEPTRYEVAGKPHHHHFLCRSCAQAFEVEGCPGAVEPLVPTGFRLEGHEVVLYGVCADCGDRGEAA